MILPIRLFPDPVLRKKSRPVRLAQMGQQKIHTVIENLKETMYAQPSGIGIAAVQVGITKKIVVLDVSARDPSKHLMLMINPILLEREGEILSREGCMSLPDYTADLKRSTRVVVEWQDEEGKRHRKSSSGIEAICLQHEIDHLNGILFIDRVASLKTDVFPRQRRKS